MWRLGQGSGERVGPHRRRTAVVCIYRVGDLLIDTGRQRVTRDGNVIALPKLSYDLLIALVRAAPNLLSIDALMEEVWPKLVVSPETVSQRIKLLRDALGDDPRNPRYVEGLRGRGYRLIPTVERGIASTEGMKSPDPTIGALQNISEPAGSIFCGAIAAAIIASPLGAFGQSS